MHSDKCKGNKGKNLELVFVILKYFYFFIPSRVFCPTRIIMKMYFFEEKQVLSLCLYTTIYSF